MPVPGCGVCAVCCVKSEGQVLPHQSAVTGAGLLQSGMSWFSAFCHTFQLGSRDTHNSASSVLVSCVDLRSSGVFLQQRSGHDISVQATAACAHAAVAAAA